MTAAGRLSHTSLQRHQNPQALPIHRRLTVCFQPTDMSENHKTTVRSLQAKRLSRVSTNMCQTSAHTRKGTKDKFYMSEGKIESIEEAGQNQTLTTH